jgi:hypothetical protein
MNAKIALNDRYKPSDKIVAREIEGEIIIIPLAAGIGDIEDELYSLNETGRSIWKHLDGVNTVQDIIAQLTAHFAGDAAVIKRDVLGLLRELKKRQFLVQKSV